MSRCLPARPPAGAHGDLPAEIVFEQRQAGRAATPPMGYVFFP